MDEAANALAIEAIHPTDGDNDPTREKILSMSSKILSTVVDVRINKALELWNSLSTSPNEDSASAPSVDAQTPSSSGTTEDTKSS